MRTPYLELFRPVLTAVASAVALTAWGGGAGGGDSVTASVAAASLTGRFAQGVGEGTSEIIAYHKPSASVYITVDNANNASSFKRVSLRSMGSVSLEDPLTDTNLEGGLTTDVAAHVNDANFTAGGVQSLAVTATLLAIAVKAVQKTDNGVIAFYALDNLGNATYQKKVTVGSLPDGVAFSHDGTKLVVANEAELSDSYGTDNIDPIGSISVITINDGIAADTATTLDFTAFDNGGSRASERPEGVRIGIAGNDFSRDAEPEYVTISADSKTAFVSLQENNAIAMVDLSAATPTISKLFALGSKDHSIAANALAASDRASELFVLKTHANLHGLYLPDGIANYTVDGVTYVLTANEGDDRDDFLPNGETARIKALSLDATAFPNAAELQADGVLGRLTVFTNMGDTDGDGDFDKLYALGGRSFSIYNTATGAQVYDSGSILETEVYGSYTGTMLAASQVTGRLDNKGPEPEGVVVGQVGDETYAFVGMERASAVAMFNITNPNKVSFVRLLTNTTDLDNGDISPEGMQFVPASESHTGKALLLVGHEVSGTLAVYTIE